MTALESAPTGKWVGQALKRKEDPRMITGRGRYVDDLAVPGMLYMAVVRSPEAHAKIVSIDTSGAKELPGIHGVFTGADLDLQAPLPMAWVPPGDRDQGGRALAAGEGLRQVRRPGRRDRRRRGQVRGRRRRRAGARRVRAAARRRRPREGARGRLVARARGDRHERDPRVGDRRRRHGGRVARRRRRHRAADRQPPHGRRADRAARLHRRLPRGHDHAAPDEPEPAPHPPVHVRRVRPVGGQDPRDRAGRRRRLRREDLALRRGGAGDLGIGEGRPPGQVDGDPHGAHELHHPRARPDRLREDGREVRRHDHRPRVHGDLRPRRVLHAAHAVHPVLHGLRDQRLLQDPEPPVHGQGRLHQQDGHRRHPRRRPAGGDPPDRGDGRADGGRARDRPARAAAEELHPEGGLPGRGRDRPRLRLRRLPRLARQAAGHGRRRGVPARAGGAARARRPPRHRLLHVDGDLRPRALAGGRPERRRPPGRLLGVLDRARARVGLRDGLLRHRAARPGARHLVRPDRRRPARHLAGAGRRRARRHRHRSDGHGHLRLALAGRRRRVDRPRHREGGRQGEEDRRAPAGGRAGGHRR